MRLLTICAVMLAITAHAPAGAQDVTVTQTPGSQDGARYAMRATADGTLRLDTRTGETTLCTTTGGKLVCAVSAEERAAYESEIDALGSRLERLEQRLIALEGSGPAELSDDETRSVDKAVSMAERAVRGFAGAVKRLRRDLGGE